MFSVTFSGHAEYAYNHIVRGRTMKLSDTPTQGTVTNSLWISYIWSDTLKLYHAWIGDRMATSPDGITWTFTDLKPVTASIRALPKPIRVVR